MTIKSQKKTQTKEFSYYGEPAIIRAEIRHDDSCRNGRNSFAITVSIFESYRRPGEETAQHSNGKTMYASTGGCLHEEIAANFPDLAPFIKWHLFDTDGPQHYVSNTVSHVKNGNYGYARKLWPEVRDAELLYMYENKTLRDALLARLPALLSEFRIAVEALGLEY